MLTKAIDRSETSLKVQIKPYNLQFKRPAGTSRGVYTDHKIWYVIVSSSDNPRLWGIGECAPLFDLSCDYNDDYENKLRFSVKNLKKTDILIQKTQKLSIYFVWTRNCDKTA